VFLNEADEKTETLEQCCLTGDVLSILLLEIAPGHEKEAASALEADASVYEGLGKYDLLAVVEEEGAIFLNEKRSFLNRTKGRFPKGTLDWMSVCGFKWSLKGKPGKPVNGNTVIGICCIKLNLEKEIEPLKAEIGLIKKIYETLDNIHVYSGLGYYEVLCLIERETIDDLSTALNAIKKAGMIDKECSMIMDVNTIPCIRFRDIDDPKLVKGTVTATITINLRTGIPLNIDRFLKEAFGETGHEIFGFHDAIVRTRMPLRDLLLNILTIRHDLADSGLYSTCTLVKHKGSKVDAIPSIPWPHSDNEAAGLKINNKTPAELIYYNDLYSVLRQDPYLHHLIRNLPHILEKENEFHNQADAYLKANQIQNYADHLRTFNSVLDLITAIVQQRLNGVLFGNLMGGKGLSCEAVGGIQRVIYALESIPSYILSSFNVNWNGLCLFGHCHSFRSWYTHEILLMPREYLLQPERFWGMNHETGHIIFIRLDEENSLFHSCLLKLYEENKSLIKQKIREEAEERETKTKQEEVTEDQIIDWYRTHFSDVFSDLVDFCYGFKGDWELYKNTIRRYLIERGALNHQHIARALIVYRTVGPGSSFSEKDARKDFFDELRSWLRKKGKRLDPALKEKAEFFADELLPAASIFSDDMRQALAKVNQTEIRKTVGTIKKSFAEGHAVLCSDPSLLMKALLSGGITPKEKFSAILSLYDCGMKSYLTS